MPAYNGNPGATHNLLQSGVPAYCFGSFNDRVSPTRMTVSNVALTTNVATLTVQVIDGNIPAVGSAIWVTGTTSTSGAFNVGSATSPVKLTGVTIDAVSGAGTITFALTHANVTSAPDSGLVTVVTPEVPETLVAGSSIAWTCPIQPSELNQGHALKAVVSLPTTPTAVTVNLQEAMSDIDSEYSTMTAVVTTASGTPSSGQITFSVVQGRFYRLNVSGITGSGTIVGKLLN